VVDEMGPNVSPLKQVLRHLYRSPGMVACRGKELALV